MIEYLEAVRLRLAPLGRQTHLIDAVGTLTYPYLLLWTSTNAPALEQDLARRRDLSFLIGVTAVGLNPRAAGDVARLAKNLLGPERFVPLAVEGRSARIRWDGFQTASVDREVTLPDSNRHPAYEVHLYQVESTPA